MPKGLFSDRPMSTLEVKSNMADCHHFKINKSPYLSDVLSYHNEISQDDAEYAIMSSN